MKFQSWVYSCSPAACLSATEESVSHSPKTRTTAGPPPKHLLSDTSSASSSSISQETTIYSSSSLQSNISLQTLPSLPSLQTFSPETLNLSVTHLCVASLKPHSLLVNSLALHNNLLYAASGNHINVFNATDYAHVATFNAAESGFIKSINFSGKRVFTAGQDSKIRVWEISPGKNHKLVAVLPTLEDRLRRFFFPKNYVTIRRHQKRLWIKHNDAVSGLADVTGGRLMCSVSWDRYLKIWKTSDLRCAESLKAHDDAINAVVVSGDGIIYTGSADRKIRVWGKAAGEKRYGLIETLEKHKSAVNALALNSDGSVLFSGACDRSILVWEREESANYMVVAGALRGHSKAILCLINFSDDLLFSGSSDRTVRIWKRGLDQKYCCLTVLDGHEKPVKSLAAVKDDSAAAPGAVKVFSGSFDGEIKVWQVVVSNHTIS